MSHDNNTDPNDATKKPAKKLVLKPLHEKELKAHLKNENKLHETTPNEKLLKELAEKTAALVDQVKGVEQPKNRILELEHVELAGPEPVDIFEKNTTQPIFGTFEHKSTDNATPALSLIRQKLNRIYQTEPNAKVEIEEVSHTQVLNSKHQQFIRELTASRKSLADIQTEWHNYYVSLTDDEKRDVWKEFYEMQHSVSQHGHQKHEHQHSTATHQKTLKTTATQHVPTSVAEVRNRIHHTISAGGKLTPIHHLKSLLFGVTVSGFIGLIIAFVFFNEVFIAPFMSPSRTVSATPIIGNIETAVDDSSKIIIPKINVEVPVVFDVGTVEESAIQDALEDGVVHYATSPNPGEQGNGVIVGHSSNNILNSGKYKFAFVLLKRLESEDVFYVQKNGVRYAYKVFEKKIVEPTDVTVLGPSSKPNTMTLITCDPPGTSINRLVIVAEQISPDPASNKKPEDKLTSPSSTTLPSNAPSLWSRLTDW